MVKPWFLVIVAGLGAGVREIAAQGPNGETIPVTEYLTSNDWTYIQVHAWLMWSSMGLLFPLGAILIRYSRSQRDPDAVVSPARPRVLFYLHIVVQCLAVALSTAGISVLLKHFGPIFEHTHMRLGLTLWIIAMMMPFIGLVRPVKGAPVRPYWYSVHWLLGTTVAVLGIINCYIGINIYQFIHGSIRTLNTLFTVQVAFMGFAYVLQDRLTYILRQGPKENPKLLSKAGKHQFTESIPPSDTV